MNNKAGQDYYDDFAATYEDERHRGYHAMLDELELEIVRPLAKEARVLEIGAGTGLIMNGLRDTAKHLTGIDISKGMLQKATDRGFQVTQASATELPFQNEQFELVYSFKVLAHVPNIRKALSEMARVLRPGGKLVAEFYNANSLRNLSKRLAGPGKISTQRTEADMYTRWDTPQTIQTYLPPEVTFETWKGIRIFTPAAFFHKIPLLAPALQIIEKQAMTSPLASFGGFLVAVCQKR
jgi:ubiquinone/menaquinone biosynthesis C-methylase UbiE